LQEQERINKESLEKKVIIQLQVDYLMSEGCLMQPFIKLEFKKPNLGNFFASFKIIDSFDIRSQDNFFLAKT